MKEGDTWQQLKSFFKREEFRDAKTDLEVALWEEEIFLTKRSAGYKSKS